MGDVQYRDEIKTLLGGAHETTSQLVTWLIFTLANNCSWATKIRTEESTDFLQHLIDETLRVYPPSYLIGRIVVAPISIAELELPTGSHILVSQYLMGRSEYYPNAEKLDPYRTKAENSVYFPFGFATPRVCPGEQLARKEALRIVQIILNSFELTGDQAAMQPEAAGNLRPPKIIVHPKKIQNN